MRRRGHLVQERPGECGLACAAMVVSAMHISHFPPKYFFEKMTKSVAGHSLKDLMIVLSGLGIDSDGILFSPAEISSLRLPAILHYSRGHFVVIYKIYAGHAFISDPVFGPLVLPLERLLGHISGAAITLR